MNTRTRLSSELKEVQMDVAISFQVTSLGLTAREWKARIELRGHELSTSALDILSAPDYDLKHRYHPGKEYKVSVVTYHHEEPQYCQDAYASHKNVTAVIQAKFGKLALSRLKGEMAFLVYEKSLEIKTKDVIVVPHEPITDSEGCPLVLCAVCRPSSHAYADERIYGHTVNQDAWDDGVGFAVVTD